METQLAIKEPSVGLMLQTMIEKGVTAENVSALEKLCALHERMQERESQREFAASFVALQGAMPAVTATKAVNNSVEKGGGVRYMFAPFDEIMRQVQPHLVSHGFTVTFDSKYEEGRMVSICTLMHTSGHSRSNSFSCRVGKGPPGSNESQADGSASSYAKRFALCNALNIAVQGADEDARLQGGPLLPATALELKERCKKCGVDETKFLQYAGADSFETITAEKYESLDEILTRREIKAGLRDAQGDMKF